MTVTSAITIPQRSGHQKRTGAQIAIDILEQYGVDVVFGIPGVHTLALYDALRSSSIRHILPRHEQGAGFMADGYARASGKPGVALVITGPGVTNIATPVGQAFTDSSPMLVLSSNVERAHIDDMRGSLHDLKDQLGVMAAVTKWNARAMSADSVAAIMNKAFSELRTGRPLPVHVEFPLDVLDEMGSIAADGSEPDLRPSNPDSELIDRAAQILANAEHPVIYCGGGAVSSGATVAIVALAERLNAPVITSIMGKGAIPEDHPLSLGALWELGNTVDDLLRSSDCALVVGSKLGSQATHGFQLQLPASTIRIDIDPREIELNYRPSLALVADAKITMETLLNRITKLKPTGNGFAHAAVLAARQAAERTSWHAERRSHVDALRRAIPRDGVLVADMTQMAYVACGVYPVYEPRTFMFPSGYGTLGFALPAAIGAKIARPGAMVVAVVGDGGFQYTMAELACAVQERISLPIVIFNDSTYSAVKEAQKESRDGRYIAVDLVNPDYVELAKAYGIPGVRVSSPDQLEAEVLAASARSTPTIIDAPIETWV
ncbi:5-guanidino-2-oxopentanoate decarboxylase [soil metagenome]